MNEEYGKFRPALKLYHASAKGNGCALELKLYPAFENAEGYIMAVFANQLSVGDRSGDKPVYSRFDWANSIAVKLDFNDLCHMLQVFRGEEESINGGKGLFHVSASANTVIRLRHMVEPTSAYVFEVSRVMNEGAAEKRSRIVLSCHEALGVAESVAGSLALVSFGLPMPSVRTSAVKNAVGKAANVVSAA